MQERLQDALDTALGGFATIAGGLGLTVQVATNFGNLVLVGLNIALAIGGLYLLVIRIKRARKDKK